jgi:hypothetical protein
MARKLMADFDARQISADEAATKNREAFRRLKEIEKS